MVSPEEVVAVHHEEAEGAQQEVIVGDEVAAEALLAVEYAGNQEHEAHQGEEAEAALEVPAAETKL